MSYELVQDDKILFIKDNKIPADEFAQLLSKYPRICMYSNDLQYYNLQNYRGKIIYGISYIFIINNIQNLSNVIGVIINNDYIDCIYLPKKLKSLKIYFKEIKPPYIKNLILLSELKFLKLDNLYKNIGYIDISESSIISLKLNGSYTCVQFPKSLKYLQIYGYNNYSLNNLHYGLKTLKIQFDIDDIYNYDIKNLMNLPVSLNKLEIFYFDDGIDIKGLDKLYPWVEKNYYEIEYQL